LKSKETERATMDDRSDAELVEMAQSGNEKALITLLERYRPVIQRQLQRYPVDDADRSDLVQDALLQVIRKLGTFRGDSQFSTWLYRVTANAALMRLRSDRRRRQASFDDHCTEAEQALALAVVMPGGEWSERADSRYDQAQRRAKLERALSNLPDGYREVVIEHYLEGEALQDLADRLGTTESAVRSRLHRARTTLRRILSDLGPSRSIPQHDQAA
jgi:RNA polymerase sigma-70 factor, ECF subfamily